jgi:hypothetical protein
MRPEMDAHFLIKLKRKSRAVCAWCGKDPRDPDCTSPVHGGC